MPITINGSGTITGISAGGLPDGSVVADDLASSLDLTGKTVTLPSGTGGKILQVKYTEKTDTFSLTTANTWTDVTDMSLSITPSSTSNHVLVSVDWAFSGNGNYTQFRVLRGSDVIYKGDASGSDRQGTGAYITNTIITASTFRDSVFFRDSPSSTSAVTYKLQMLNDGETSYINRGYTTNANTRSRTASSITLMEVAG